MKEKTFEYTMKVETEGPIEAIGLCDAVLKVGKVKDAAVVSYRVKPTPKPKAAKAGA